MWLLIGRAKNQDFSDWFYLIFNLIQKPEHCCGQWFLSYLWAYHFGRKIHPWILNCINAIHKLHCHDFEDFWPLPTPTDKFTIYIILCSNIYIWVTLTSSFACQHSLWMAPKFQSQSHESFIISGPHRCPPLPINVAPPLYCFEVKWFTVQWKQNKINNFLKVLFMNNYETKNCPTLLLTPCIQ